MIVQRIYQEERPPPTEIGFRVQVSSLILPYLLNPATFKALSFSLNNKPTHLQRIINHDGRKNQTDCILR
jgi:hypothetical protein